MLIASPTHFSTYAVFGSGQQIVAPVTSRITIDLQMLRRPLGGAAPRLSCAYQRGYAWHKPRDQTQAYFFTGFTFA